MKRVLLVFGIFAVLASGVAWGLMPTTFFAMGFWSVLGFGALSAASLAISNSLEVGTWRMLHPDVSGNVLYRLLVRLGIYWGVPTAAIYAVGSIWPTFLFLPAGVITALAASYSTMMVAAILELMPAKIKS